MTTAPAFTIGETYSTRSICDSECVWTWTVTARTAKFVTLEDRHGYLTRVGVNMWEGVESAKPLGRFSMSPTIYADRRFEP